jgi:hypothetical protein
MPAPLTDRARRILDQMTPAERLALLDELTNFDECAEAIDRYVDHDQTPKGWDEVPAYTETEREAFARGGMAGLNESRGYDSYTPEPCGQHCFFCPRCGY